MVHAADRRDLRAGAAEEDLVGDVQLGAVDRALDDGHAELLAHQRHDRVARDAFEDVLGDRRRDQSTPLRSMNRFSALPSETWPSAVSMIASSKPLSSASVLAKALLM